MNPLLRWYFNRLELHAVYLAVLLAVLAVVWILLTPPAWWHHLLSGVVFVLPGWLVIFRVHLSLPHRRTAASTTVVTLSTLAILACLPLLAGMLRPR